MIETLADRERIMVSPLSQCDQFQSKIKRRNESTKEPERLGDQILWRQNHTCQNQGIRRSIWITVENRDYHQLSRVEIGGENRIYQQ
jgi:hypothetical protein